MPLRNEQGTFKPYSFDSKSRNLCEGSSSIREESYDGQAVPIELGESKAYYKNARRNKSTGDSPHKSGIKSLLSFRLFRTKRVEEQSLLRNGGINEKSDNSKVGFHPLSKSKTCPLPTVPKNGINSTSKGEEGLIDIKKSKIKRSPRRELKTQPPKVDDRDQMGSSSLAAGLSPISDCDDFESVNTECERHETTGTKNLHSLNRDIDSCETTTDLCNAFHTSGAEDLQYSPASFSGKSSRTSRENEDLHNSSLHLKPTAPENISNSSHSNLNSLEELLNTSSEAKHTDHDSSGLSELYMLKSPYRRHSIHEGASSDSVQAPSVPTNAVSETRGKKRLGWTASSDGDIPESLPCSADNPKPLCEAVTTIKAGTSKATSEDDLTCPICLDVVYRPRQLDCNHFFCLICLQNYANTCKDGFTCPSCRRISEIPPNGVQGFRRNKELEKNARRLVQNQVRTAERCSKCDSQAETTRCSHCRKCFCPSCALEHSVSLEGDIAKLKTRLESVKEKLRQEERSEEANIGKIKEGIKVAVKEKVSLIEQKGQELIDYVDSISNLNRDAVAVFTKDVEEALKKYETHTPEFPDVAKRHSDATELVERIFNDLRISRLSLDRKSASINVEQGPLLPCNQLASVRRELGRLPSADTLKLQRLPNFKKKYSSFRDRCLFYTNKSTFCKSYLATGVCGRPTSVAICPWSGYLYLTGSDACKVFVFEQGGRSIETFGSRGHGEGSFLCPSGVAFNGVSVELLVSDKWKHSILVFNSSNEFCKELGGKGHGFGQFYSPEGIATDSRGHIYVADTCNNRIQVLDRDGLFLREIGGITPRFWNDGLLSVKRQLLEPSAVFVSQDGCKVYVADAGDHRIKIFDGRTGRKTQSFGGRGLGRGEFSSPEAIYVDPSGFLLVGDSGNGRVQVFKPNGHFLRYFGCRNNERGEFSWVSGITITDTGQVIVTDFQNSQVATF